MKQNDTYFPHLSKYNSKSKCFNLNYIFSATSDGVVIKQRRELQNNTMKDNKCTNIVA